MRHAFLHSPLAACALAATLVLSACGGGGASSPGGTVSGSSGFAVDDYLRGASVLCDSNNNGVADSGETTVLTDSSGFFRFVPACAATMVVTGGTNIDTGLPFGGTLKAPAGATVVTPLTTLVTAGMTVDQVNAALGLPAGTDLLNTDPARKLAGALVNGDLMRKSLAVQQVLQKASEILAGLATVGGDAARPAIYSEVAAALAAALPGGNALMSGNTVDAAIVAKVIKAATLRIANSSGLAAEVRSGAQGINADSLSQVVAGAIKAQADSILMASNIGLTDATRTAQSDTQITAFVAANRTQLAVAPDGTTLNLASTLTNQVLASLNGSTPPPSTEGTLLVSFDEANPAFSNMGAFGGALPTVEAGPSGGSGNALRILKPVAPDTWGGIFFNVSAIPFAANRTTLTARVNSTRAGAVILLKVESGNGGPAVEIAGTTVASANTWQTVTWDLAGVDVAKSYTVIAITPDQNVVTTGQSYYIDDIRLAPASAPPPTLPAPTGTTLVSFDEANPAFSNMGAYGGALPTVEAGPSGGTGNALRILKPVAPDTWGGIFFNVSAIPFAADRKTLSARVNSTRAGAIILLKVESGNGGPAVEIAGTTVATANAWQTVVWNLNGVDITKSYTVIAITPDQNVSTTGQSYFIDDLTLENAGSGDGGANPLNFSAGFSAGETTANGGKFGGFSGSNLDGFNCNGQPTSCGGGGAFSGDAASSFYYYYQTPTPAAGLYMGIFVLAPNLTEFSATADASGVQITNQTMLKFTLGQNPEWFGTATNNFGVEIDLGKLYTAGGNACRLQVRRVVTPLAATATDYSIALSSFTISQNCGTNLTVAQAFAISPVSQVTFKANGGTISLGDGTRTTGANLSVANGGFYATTIEVKGAITFE